MDGMNSPFSNIGDLKIGVYVAGVGLDCFTSSTLFYNRKIRPNYATHFLKTAGFLFFNWRKTS